MNTTLKIPAIRNYIHWLGRVGYRSLEYSFTYDERSYELLDELYSLLQRIKPTGKNNAWNFWIKAERGTIEDFGNYEEMLEDGEVENYAEFEQRWKDEYPDEIEWFDFHAIYDEEIDYRAIWVHHKFVIEQDNRKEKSYEHDISVFVQWLVDQVKNVIFELEAGTYNSRVESELPVKHRVGTVLRKHEWDIYPNVKETIIGNMTDEDIRYFLSYAKSSIDENEPRLAHISANDFYRYCAMGYKACGYYDTDKTPKEQYYLRADGRDENLSAIDLDNPDAFSEWYHNERIRGGHPWEVCRGGNSTHVSLYVWHDEKGWSLNVAGSAWTRCAEAAQFFLALHRAGLPVSINQAEMLKRRLMGEEKIGIVPDGVFPAYCDSYFPGEEVIDFSNLPHETEDCEKLLPHCIWQPLTIIELNEALV